MAWVLRPDTEEAASAAVDTARQAHLERGIGSEGGWRLRPEAPAPPAEKGLYQRLAEPVRKAVSRVADGLTEPLVAASRVAQGEPVSQVMHSYSPKGSPSRYDTPALRAADYEARSQRTNPLADFVVPDNAIEATANVATVAAPYLSPLRPLVRAIPYLGRVAPAGTARVAAGAIGGEGAGLATGETPGKGTLIGGGGALAGEGAGKVIEAGRRMLPGAKKAISLDDTRRVGADIADVTGAPPMRTPGDVLDAATGAATRQTRSAADYDAAITAHRQAVEQARAEAARLTREGRATQAADWKRQQQEYQRTVDQLETEAAQATAGLQRTTDAMTGVVNTRNRGRAAQGLHDVIGRVAPQLSEALRAPGAAGLRDAGAGGARRVLGEGKEAVTRQLADATPDGILVPSLSDEPIPVRQAIEELSLLAAGQAPQFSRNPLDRNILGAAARRRAGQVRREIAQGLDEVETGLGGVFDEGQRLYREGFALSKTLLEPNRNWTPTGDVNVNALATDIIKPRMRRALSDKIGPDNYQQIADTVPRLPRELPRQHAPRMEAVLPEPPVKPPPVAPVAPNIPPEPTQAPQSAADIVMTALFGPQNRIQQGQDTLVNWPAVQKGLQTPKVRAEIEAAVGQDGYAKILASVLRGAKQGADEPSRGSGRFGEAFMDWAGGRNPGGGAFASMWHRSVLPNWGGRYIGNKPMQLPPALQAILDAAGQRGASAISGERR